MSTDIFTFRCEALPELALVGFKAVEHISQPYEVEIFFTLPVETAVRGAVGHRATLLADRGDDTPPLAWHGVIAGISLLHEVAERALYRALLVPKLWMLRHSWRSHVFTKQKVNEFLSDTLKHGGLETGEFRFAIASGYPIEEFVAQYRETHLDFFHRWLEREGLYYYFEHDPTGTNEVLVIVDNRGQHEAFPGGPTVRYVPLFGDDATAPQGLHQLEQDLRWLPKSVVLADYNYATPAASVLGESAVTAAGLGTIREYGYRVFVQSDATRLAEVRAQSIGCREVTLRAEGDALGPRAGYKLTLDDQPSHVAAEWLAVEVRHAGALAGATAEVRRHTGVSGDKTYRSSLFAIPADAQYRAPQATPWPRIYSLENGVVCGEADSEYAQIDSDGRYFVRFEFDGSDLADGHASTRVRMMQPHGGGTEGFHFPLRKGTEVMIAFLGGDPDRPFIAGVVPNAHKPSVVADRNHTQNIIRTGSGNQLVMEDERGKEFIFLQTPNNKTGIYLGHPTGDQASVYTGEGEQVIAFFFGPDAANPAVDANSTLAGDSLSLWQTSDGHAGLFVGGNSWTNIMGNRSTYVDKNVADGYLGTYMLKVGGQCDETYYAKRNTIIKAGRTDTVEAGGETQDIHGGLTQTVEPKGSQTVTGPWTHKVTALAHDDYKTWQTDVATTWTGKFGADVNLESDTNFMIKAPMAKITATDYKINILGLTFHYTPAKHEIYVYKGASGVIKTDHAVIYQSAYGIKMDFSLVKLENHPLKNEQVAAHLKTAGAYMRKQALATVMAAALMHNVAFTKL